MSNSTARMNTRSKNAAVRPGLVDVPPKRPRAVGQTKKEAAKERKEAKAEKREAAVRKLAGIEQQMAENDAVDTTPGPRAGKAGPRQLRRTETYVQHSTDEDSNSDKEMLLDESEPVMDHGERNDDTATDYEAPPKKKAKTGIRESIKSYLENGGGDGDEARGSANDQRQRLVGATSRDEGFNWRWEGSDNEAMVSNSPGVDKTPKKLTAAPKSKNKARARSSIDDKVQRRVGSDSDVDVTPKQRTVDKGQVKAPTMGRPGRSDDKPIKPGKPNQSERHVVLIFHCCITSMLTLDATTLFYYSLSDTYTTNAKDTHSGLINDWAAKVPHFSKLPTSKSASTSSKSRSTPSLTTSSSRSSRPPTLHSSRPPVSRSALTNDVRISAPDDEEVIIVDDEGAFSERDETKGNEREAAIKSPLKGSTRVTSTTLVKLEDSPKAKPRQRQNRPDSKKPKNSELPQEWLEGGIWRKRVIPTLIRWAGIQADPWNIPDTKIVNALNIICGGYYGELPKSTITPTSTPFRLGNQRLCDGWRGTFPSSAQVILHAFFDSEAKYRDSDLERQKFARHSLDKLRFMYKHAEGNDKKKFRGSFLGPLLIQIFATHFNVISGSKWILGLYTEDSPPKPRAALALSAAAGECILTLWATGTLTIEMVRAAKESGKSIKLPAMVNPQTGKPSTRATAFGELSWGDTTRNYLASINGIDDAKMEEIMDAAKEFSKASNSHYESTVGSYDPDDERANIGSNSGSDIDDAE